MIIETLIVCVTVYAILTPVVYACVELLREKARRLDIENDILELKQNE